MGLMQNLQQSVDLAREAVARGPRVDKTEQKSRIQFGPSTITLVANWFRNTLLPIGEDLGEDTSLTTTAIPKSDMFAKFNDVNTTSITVTPLSTKQPFSNGDPYSSELRDDSKYAFSSTPLF